MNMNKQCEMCGGWAVCQVDSTTVLCASCAEKTTVARLESGEAVIVAIEGEPIYLLLPTDFLKATSDLATERDKSVTKP